MFDPLLFSSHTLFHLPTFHSQSNLMRLRNICPLQVTFIKHQLCVRCQAKMNKGFPLPSRSFTEQGLCGEAFAHCQVSPRLTCQQQSIISHLRAERVLGKGCIAMFQFPTQHSEPFIHCQSYNTVLSIRRCCATPAMTAFAGALPTTLSHCTTACVKMAL